jgi:HEAT repeat protein
VTVVQKTSGAFTLDRDLVVQTWDAWMESVTGIPESAAIGSRLDALYPELTERGLLQRLRSVSEGGGVDVLAPALHRYLLPCAPRDRDSRFERMRQRVTMSSVRSGESAAGVRVVIEDVTPRFDRSAQLSIDLDSADDSVRLRAATALASARDAPETLSGALSDESWRVRRVAAEGLADAAGNEAVETLLRAIREHHHDPALLNAAITSLAHSRADVLPAILPLLAAEEADQRTYAALTLGLLGDARAVAPLLAMLGDADANAAFHAVEALGRIGAPDAAEPLAAVATGDDFFLAFAALDALAAIGDPMIAMRIVPLLDDAPLAAAVAHALGAVGSEDVVAPLAALLARADGSAGAAAQALASIEGRIGREVVAEITRASVSTAAVHALLDAASVANEDEVTGLATVLSWFDADGVDALLESLLHRDTKRERAAELLGTRGSAAAGRVAHLMRDESPAVRRTIAETLGRIGSADSAPVLAGAAADEDDAAVLIAIVNAIGAIGDRRAFPALIALTEHPNAAVRQGVVAALNSIGEPAMERVVGERLASPASHARESAARIVGYFGYASCLAPLIGLCADPDATVRRAAVEALPIFDEAAAGDAVIHLAQSDADTTVRSAAVRALGELRGHSSMESLVDALHDTSPWVRYYAARAAAQRGERSEPLIAALAALARDDQATPARIAALEALSTLDPLASADIVLALANDVDLDIATAAIASLGACDPERTASTIRDAIESAEPALQHAALDAVERQGVAAGHAVPVIGARARGSQDEVVRGHAIRALGAVGDEGAIRELASLGGLRRLRDLVSTALAGQPADRLPALERALATSDDHARELIVNAIGGVADTAALRVLAARLDDPAPRVRAAAARWLHRHDLRIASGTSART